MSTMTDAMPTITNTSTATPMITSVPHTPSTCTPTASQKELTYFESSEDDSASEEERAGKRGSATEVTFTTTGSQ